MATASHAASFQPAPPLGARNYYADEVIISNPCIPKHMGLWCEEGVPEEGWFPILERCAGNYTLKTTYGAAIEQGVMLYLTDENGRISGVVTRSEYRDIPPVKAAGYKEAEAKSYAGGVSSALYTYLLERGLAGGGMVWQKGTCIGTIPELRPLAWNMLQGTHFRFPFTRLVNDSAGWCVHEP